MSDKVCAFQLDERLAAASLPLTIRHNLDYRLMNDSRFVWLLLIPRLPNITEWSDLAPDVQHDLFHRATQLAEKLKNETGADKMNIATIGNMVSQFHLHIIARKIDDALWPDPVWGKPGATAYGTAEQDALTARLMALIDQLDEEESQS